MTQSLSLAVFAAAALFATKGLASNFTISNGQIFTPGFVVVDSPQPDTPLGGDNIEIALDVSANGKLPLPPYGDDASSQIYNINIFLYSYVTGRNFTITNGTASVNNATLGDIMLSEPGSTVKHVRWTWPDCMVGDGTNGNDRGSYNVGFPNSELKTVLIAISLTTHKISIHQRFRLNGENHYTMFDLPISVTNSISKSDDRPSCQSLDNPLLAPENIDRTDTNELGALFAPGDSTVIETSDVGSGSGLASCKHALDLLTGSHSKISRYWALRNLSNQNKMAPQTKDEVADDNEFVGFDEESDEEMHDNDDMSVDDEEEDDSDMDSIGDPRKTYDIDEKDSDEEDLERFVLGNNDTFRAQLFRDDFLADITDSKALIRTDKQDDTTGLEHVDDNALFAFDTGVPGDKKQTEATPSALEAYEQKEDPPAWEDSDDERLTVSLAAASRLRKLRQSEEEDVVNGTEYARRLRSQYLRLYPLPEWAKESSAATQRRRRRSSAAGSSSEEDSDAEDDVESALPLETFLRDVNSFNASADARGSKRRKLRPETIDIQRSRDIPDIHKQSVSSLSFHPKHPILLSCSVSSIMYLHQVDPTAHPVPNPALTSVQVKRTDLRRSEFLGPDGDDIIFAGRRRYFHSWNLSSGAVKKITQIQGHQREQRTMEHFRPSPCGRYLGLIASEKKGGGMINIVNVRTMQWIAQARTNGRGGISDFAWWGNGNGLSILGKNGQVTEWSMLSRRTVGVWRDEGSIGGTVIALGGQKGTGPSQIGGDRWVAVGSNSGILNIYDRNDLVEPVKKEGGALASKEETVQIKSIPTPQRTFEQLTTPISVVTFAPDGQLLAFGSFHKKDALRLVHLPSCTVYRNWPTEQTPLGRITAVAFSHQNGGDVLAVGNDVGKIRMWEIRS
ncbi:WD40 repeat-like protein [Neurospora hispaniola]|uniref:WD40 repeat-like protein n=1 Tax=Neurospora hispaniola TaxID=588809 RepID=A0AAJ0IDQ9_9PEZI|nr:WD40 repeat-like protein [Neurospora hispaniola]